MTTRNQKRRATANSKPPSPETIGVDFPKQQIVALPASNPPSSLSVLDGKPDDNLIPNGIQLDSSISKNSLSSPAIQLPPATPSSTVASSVVKTTSNPVVKDICALKAGELKVVSPAISKFFGFPAGPVANLDFSDPKVADFFDVPVSPPPDMVPGTVVVLGASVKASRSEVAALVPTSTSEPIQNPTITVPPTLLQQGTPIPSAVVGSEKMPFADKGGVEVPGSANPVKAAVSAHIPTPSAPSWAGLFKNNRTPCDGTSLKPCFAGMHSEELDLNDDDMEDSSEEKRSLIGFFNGKFLGINAIERIVDEWSRKCTFYTHSSGWLVFSFDDEKDCELVLKEGPYYAFNKPLVLKQMPEFFDFSDEAYSTAPVWIQLPNLPLRAWKKTALEKICTFLGTPLHMDQVTKEKSHISFARCLVEIDISKVLPNLVICNLPNGKVLRQHVLYEDVPTFCANCKKLGHETEDCYAKNNGKPSLYVARSKFAREKKKVHNLGTKKKQPGVAKANVGHASGSGKSTPAAAVPLGTIDKSLGTVEATGSLGSKSDARQSVHAPKEPVLNCNNGKNVEAIAKDSGLVSANSFGPLTNDNVGNWADDAETSDALVNNNKKKNNGKKK